MWNINQFLVRSSICTTLGNIQCANIFDSVLRVMLAFLFKDPRAF